MRAHTPSMRRCSHASWLVSAAGMPRSSLIEASRPGGEVRGDAAAAMSARGSRAMASLLLAVPGDQLLEEPGDQRLEAADDVTRFAQLAVVGEREDALVLGVAAADLEPRFLAAHAAGLDA